MGRGLIGTLLAATLMVPGVARADWREAVSNNFIVVSDESEKVVRQRVEGLERFGLILQALTGARRLKTPPVKIKVFFVKDIPDVQNTMPYPSEGIAGYYSASIRGPFAVMPRLDNGRFLWSTSAKVIMQHELTHHFTFQYFPAAYPSWYSEGFADYAGAITVSEDGVAMIGLTREDRIQMIQFSNWIPVSKLLTMKSYADAHGNIGALYGEGWLLVHYLNSTPEGKTALNKYLVAINAGQSYTDAAAAFGDLSVLDRKLKTYGSRLSLHATETHYTNIDIGPVSVRTLAPDEAALVSADISLSSGIAAARMPDFVRDVRQTAARFPTSPSALHILTETERRAGNVKQASVAADQWLAAAPQDPLAMLNRAQLDIEALKASKSTDAAAWNAARKRILAANKLAPNDPQILKGYYDSYVSQGQLPPAPAQNALAGALENLPQDDDLRYEVASDYEARGMIDDAIFVIRPAAYQAHGDTDLTPREKAKRDEIKRRYPIAGDTEPAESPMEMLNRLEKKKAETTKANPG